MRITKLLSAILATVLVTSLVPAIGQAEVTYEEQDSNSNIAENFTGSAKVVYGQTPSFTVKIPKSIDLDGEGAGTYTVGVKGKIPSKYVINIVPDETITMVEENNLLDSIIADVTAEKTTWTANELNENSYAESTNNTIQMQSIDFAKFKGTLNFNISAKMPVELKDASDEVKATNNYVGQTTIDALSATDCFFIPNYTFTAKANDIVYIVGGSKAHYTKPDAPVTLSTGYYSCKVGTTAISGGTGVRVIDPNGKLLDVEYLGESYLV